MIYWLIHWGAGISCELSLLRAICMQRPWATDGWTKLGWNLTNIGKNIAYLLIIRSTFETVLKRFQSILCSEFSFCSCLIIVCGKYYYLWNYGKEREMYVLSIRPDERLYQHPVRGEFKYKKRRRTTNDKSVDYQSV